MGNGGWWGESGQLLRARLAFRSDGTPMLRGRRSTTTSAPWLVSDGAIRHAPQAELGQGTHLVTFEAHQRDQHLVPFAVENGRRAATARLRLSAGRGLRLPRNGEHGRGDLVEHGEPQIIRLI
jgi:hypothetical protein